MIAHPLRADTFLYSDYLEDSSHIGPSYRKILSSRYIDFFALVRFTSHKFNSDHAGIYDSRPSFNQVPKIYLAKQQSNVYLLDGPSLTLHPVLAFRCLSIISSSYLKAKVSMASVSF